LLSSPLLARISSKPSARGRIQDGLADGGIFPRRKFEPVTLTQGEGRMTEAAANQVLESFRAYLSVLARIQIDPRMQGKLDLSGIVQQTLLEAYQSLERMQGWDEAQKAAWLRRALANNLADEIRKLRTEARDVCREQSLDAGLEESSARLAAWLAADQSSPSERAQHNEQSVRIALALERLPADTRTAIILQHWHGWTLAQIAEHLQRTPGAVAGLLHRGLHQLKEYLQPPSET
jgi:RNA polymerase sigma-70 factor (ECF subfamily)